MDFIDKQLFGPLNKKYCNIFYALAVVSFAMAVIILVNGVTLFVGDPKKLTFEAGVVLAAMVAVHVVQYIQSRLLYSICAGKTVSI
jgi:hypothetical protein